MKIKTPTEFQTFNDGICDIYTVKTNKIDEKIMSLRFGDRTVGMKRYYTARAANVDINRLIQIPQQLSITSLNRAVIENNEYKIEQVQHIKDTNPPVTILTLKRIGVIV
ncbi:hypothetical protein [Sporanaerobacter sp. PP17-6a]|uniref:hypothetical protein n=1 Tax=Sporanaerobacter sp. PP17-6a TaxID=1891289 RepID=UPI0008A01FAD|nr:hypothetical protein [Sporanaerobacter sp. PP17-6a]SCL88016.1 hypothetical protein PP176A_1444 [Sporanaerobacter sp. PP17-6a]